MNKKVLSIVAAILISFISFGPSPAITYAESSESTYAESLGMTTSEFEILDAAVHDYLYGKYPFLLDTEFGIRYETVDTKEEGMSPESLVVDAYASFRTPPVVIRSTLNNGKVEIISESVIDEIGNIRTLDLNRTIEKAIVLQQQQIEQRVVEIDGDPNPEFTIYWRYGDFPSNARADEVINLLETAARTSWATVCGNGAGQWDFDEPPDDDGGADIYVNDNLHGWGPFNSTGTFQGKIGTDQIIYIQHNVKQWLSDAANIEYPDEPGCFVSTLSHEFFHCVQDAYGVLACRLWVIEGTARFEQTVINPSGEFYTPQSDAGRSAYIYNAVKYLQSPEGTLRDKNYDACIYWRYMYEHHGSMSLIRDIFSQIETDNPATFEAELDCINDVLQPATTVDDDFVAFALANYLEFSSNPAARDNEYYEQSTCYYKDAALVHNKTYEYKGKAMSIDGLFGDTKVRSHAANYIEFISKQTENDNVQIVFSGNKDTTFVRRIIAYNNTYPQGEIIDFSKDSIVVPYPNDFDRITIVMSNTGHTGNGDYWVLLRPMKDIDAILDFDRSGSMAGSKITGAKTAAKTFIDILEKPSGWWIFKTDRDKIGLVSFATSATLNLHLTSDFATAKSIINGFAASGNTNMGDALTKSINELNTNARDDTIRAIVYLTDGQTNTGLSKQQILNTLVPQAVNAGIFIYTLGYGSDADPAFLSQVASAGNGKYYFAPDAATLRQVYIDLSHTTKGWEKIASFSGTVTQGQTKTVGVLNILPGTSLFKVLLSWGGSDLDLILIDPNGNPSVPGPGVIYSGNDNLPEYYEIYEPQPGSWTVKVFGKSVPAAGEKYYVAAFKPGALMQVKPTKWEIDYPTNRVTTFTVSEVAGMVDLTGVTFTASDLYKINTAAIQERMAAEAELEELGEPIPTVESAMTEQLSIIPSSSFTFNPNNFTVPSGSSQDVQATLTVPPHTPGGDYSGAITVTGGNGSATISVLAHVPIPVAIDIKPGSDPNSINLDSKGVIPVAILTTNDSEFEGIGAFDATTVIGETVHFGPNKAVPVHYALEDADKDGDIDMILQFKTLDAGIAQEDTEAVLIGGALDGQYFYGKDSVRIVPPKSK